MKDGQIETKHCRKCNENKSLAEFYVINGTRHAPCRECRKADARERLRVDEHYRERSRQRSRDRYHAQLERDKENRARWVAANREKLLADARERGKRRYAEKRLAILQREKERSESTREARRLEQEARRANYRASKLSLAEKACTNCGRVKSIEEFARKKIAADGRHSWCNSCKRLALNERRARDRLTPEGRRKQRAAGLRQWHDMTIQEFDVMWAAQGGLCKACGEPLMDGKDHVDHDHKTGRIRGILCDACNRGLGYIRESASRAEGLAQYIRLYSDPQM